MEFRSHDFDDEPKKGFLISSSVAHSKSVILDPISGFLNCCNIWYFMHKLGTISFKLCKKYFDKWSQSDFTDVNSGRAGGGILRRMLFIKVTRIVWIVWNNIS